MLNVNVDAKRMVKVNVVKVNVVKVNVVKVNVGAKKPRF